MNVKRCDRCGMIYDIDPILTVIQKDFSVKSKRGIPRQHRIDLCPACVQDILNWLDQEEEIDEAN